MVEKVDGDSQEWRHTNLVPALRRLRQGDGELEASLSYVVRWRVGVSIERS